MREQCFGIAVADEDEASKSMYAEAERFQCRFSKRPALKQAESRDARQPLVERCGMAKLARRFNVDADFARSADGNGAPIAGMAQTEMHGMAGQKRLSRWRYVDLHFLRTLPQHICEQHTKRGARSEEPPASGDMSDSAAPLTFFC